MEVACCPLSHVYKNVEKCVEDKTSRMIPLYLMPRKFSKEEKHNIERIIAATFIIDKIGYNYPLNQIILKKKNIEINSNCYTNTMTSVIRNVFRAIEKYVQEKGLRKVTPVTAEQMMMMRSPLVQARQWLYKDELETFFKFIRLTYNLSGDTDISVEAARRLHGQIILALEKQAKRSIQKLVKRQGSRNHPGRDFHTYRMMQKQQ